MSLLRLHRWYVAAAAVTLAFAAVSLTAHRGPALIAFGDIAVLLLMLVGTAIMLAKSFAATRLERRFWALMALGFFLWCFNQAAWTYREVLLHTGIPVPFFADVVEFFHLLPIMAATGWRPDLTRDESRFQLGTLNLLMLLAWWVFLYAFIVGPHQYVVVN